VSRSDHDGNRDRGGATAREAVLRQVAAATEGVRDDDPVAAHVRLKRGYRRNDERTREALLDLLEERLVDYGVDVIRTGSAELASVLSTELDRRRAQLVVVPTGAPDAWTAALDGRRTIADGAGGLELDEADATLSGCAVAIAETGTIVLDGGPGQGRRAATLLPDLHLCVLNASDVVALVPEAVARMQLAVESGAALTWISGPSATSDIELVRVAGVHGPRTLVVALVHDA